MSSEYFAIEASERDFVMQMRRRGDRDGINAGIQHRFIGCEGRAPDQIGGALAVRGVGIGDADIALALAYVAYAFVFNIVYDRVFPIAGEA